MELYERRCRILAAVVHDYVETAEPVGSETLARKHDFGVKSATIRNELAAMSDMGYLRQPHTSAGRIPSDLGYRYYVDQLMLPVRLRAAEAHRVRSGYDPYKSEVEEILQRTCRILSGLTMYTSLATAPHIDVAGIRQLALLDIGNDKLLLVTVLSTGHVDHRTLDYHAPLSPGDVIKMGNFLNERFQGADLNSFQGRVDEELPADLARLETLYQKAAVLLKQALTGTTNDELFMDGTSNILKQPEFVQRDRAASILEALEHRKELFQILSTALLGNDVTVIIGSENTFSKMRECSFVASSYRIGDRVCGSIGVIGPTRMDYRRAVAAVKFMASNLSTLLASLSIG